MNNRSDAQIFELLEVEVETLRRAAMARDLPFDPARTRYTASELEVYGLVREAYNSEELCRKGVDKSKVVTSFDPEVSSARDTLLVDAPFAESARKWQLPIDLCESRTLITEFSPGTSVSPHMHPANTPEDPGGSLRVVLSGAIDYAGKTFKGGDWFYIPNGVPYSFKTTEETDTIVLYCYAFFAPSMGNRFSSPIELVSMNEAKSDAA